MKYWFPVYTKGDGTLHFSGGHGYMHQDVHMREVMKYSDYKKCGSSVKITYDGQDVGKDAGDGKAGAGAAPAPPAHVQPH